MGDNYQIKEQNTEYLNKRLQELGIKSSHNEHYIKLLDTEYKYHFFEADNHGNIVINYYNIHGNIAQFRKDGNKWEETFTRKRLLNPFKNSNGETAKYLSPKNSGLRPFFPPKILKKYQQKEHIETLFVTEGEFKAFKGELHGFDIIGIPSIHGFYDSEIKTEKKLHYEIELLISDCTIKNIVYLTDADTLTVNWEYEKELSKRPISFYTAVKNFRQTVYPLVGDKIDKIYFSHISTFYNNCDAKGLDDLLVKFPSEENEILADALLLNKSKKYFQSLDITDKSTVKTLYKYFGLDRIKTFYEIYADFIGDNEFKFRNAIYQSIDGINVRFIEHHDSKNFLRVGGNWYKITYVPNEHGDLEREVMPYPKTEIKEDYEFFPKFLSTVPKYDSFTVFPNWLGEYNGRINNAFNLYSPLEYKPKVGNWEHTYNFLKHVFQGDGSIDLETGEENNIKGDQFTVALDYLTILLKHPKHLLPILALVSKDQGTGKTTFLHWLAEIYRGNSTVLNNDQFNSNFNRHYITKFIIGIDEAVMGADNKEAKKDKERIKQLLTNGHGYLEDKGVNLKKIPFYGKIFMTSNDDDSLMKIDDEDTRFFIVKIHPIPKSIKNPDLFGTLKKEIPHFLNYLANRTIFHERKDRFWFETEDYLTDQFHVLREATKSNFDATIDEVVKNFFYTFPDLDTLKIHADYLLKLINNISSRKYGLTTLKKRLKKGGINQVAPARYKIPIEWVEDALTNNEVIKYTEKYRLWHYCFERKDWLTEIEDLEIKEPKIF